MKHSALVLSLCGGQTNNAALLSRAKQSATLLELSQTALLTKLKTEVANMEADLSKTLDLGPDESTSLRPGAIANPEELVNKIQKLKKDLVLKKVEVKLAEETMAEFQKEVDDGNNPSAAPAAAPATAA
jgi:hypothetical protein